MSDTKVHLPVVGQDPAPPRRRHPEWIRATLPTKPAFFELRAMVKELQLHTVCESASCPNIGECWTRRALTIMILGDICTRSCRFCDVTTGRPLPAKTLVFGEVGLAGEIRPVQRGQERIKEAAKLGFKQVLIPNLNKPKQAIDGMKVMCVDRVDQALSILRE